MPLIHAAPALRMRGKRSHAERRAGERERTDSADSSSCWRAMLRCFVRCCAHASFLFAFVSVSPLLSLRELAPHLRLVASLAPPLLRFSPSICDCTSSEWRLLQSIGPSLPPQGAATNTPALFEHDSA